MGEQAEIWQAMKERRQAGKNRNYQEALDADWPVTWFRHTDYHWSVRINGEKFDYWPSTKKMGYMGVYKSITSVNALRDYLQKKVDGGEIG